MRGFVETDEALLHSHHGLVKKNQAIGCVKKPQHLGHRAFDGMARLLGFGSQLRQEAQAEDVFLDFLDTGDRHDAIHRCRKNAERARFTQRTLGFLADSKSLARSQTAIVRPAHDYFRFDRM